jgi:hypothetical protein
MLKKKILANFQRIIELFTQKIVTKLSKYGFGIRDPEKNLFPDPGSRGQKGTGSRIRIRNTVCTIIHIRFLPFFFVLGAAVEFSMINWTVGDTNFYKTFKKRQGKDHVYINVKGFSPLPYILRFTHLPVLSLFA